MGQTVRFCRNLNALPILEYERWSKFRTPLSPVQSELPTSCNLWQYRSHKLSCLVRDSEELLHPNSVHSLPLLLTLTAVGSTCLSSKPSHNHLLIFSAVFWQVHQNCNTHWIKHAKKEQLESIERKKEVWLNWKQYPCKIWFKCHRIYILLDTDNEHRSK